MLRAEETEDLLDVIEGGRCTVVRTVLGEVRGPAPCDSDRARERKGGDSAPASVEALDSLVVRPTSCCAMSSAERLEKNGSAPESTTGGSEFRREDDHCGGRLRGQASLVSWTSRVCREPLKTYALLRVGLDLGGGESIGSESVRLASGGERGKGVDGGESSRSVRAGAGDSTACKTLSSKQAQINEVDMSERTPTSTTRARPKNLSLPCHPTARSLSLLIEPAPILQVR